MKTHLIVHGHFYQPPRQNPYTGVIDKEISNSPFNNYNELISDCCYEANAHSRYLSFDGRVEKIVNNYSYISFNFGPTLLQWFDQYRPNMVESLVQGDKASLKRLGHGNAIAQGYNHTILPLSTDVSRTLQIDWALKDFEKHFNRASEGFWCPECAVDDDTLYALASNGVKYVVLSPFQAKGILTDKGYETVKDGRISCNQSYAVKVKDKEIAVFFYNSELASSVSFAHMLRNADSMYSRLVQLKASYPNLISYATDGEIYGHHEGYGDMAIAALIQKVEADDKLEFTNWAKFLEDNPPTQEAFIVNPSSWSCCHGVERWRSDCGCSTGSREGWNQKWRVSLRKGFEEVLGLSEEILETRIESIAKNSSTLEMLKDYGNVLCHNISLVAFASKYNVENKDLTEFASLLESRRCLENSFTSCGWFFNDISGIEPRKNIAFCLRAIELLQPYTEVDLKARLYYYLELAKSNIEGNGKTLAIKDRMRLEGYLEASLYFYVGNKLALGEAFYGDFLLISFNNDTIRLLNQRTLEFYDLQCVETENPWNLSLCLDGQCHSIKTKDIPETLMDVFAKWIDTKLQHFDKTYLEDLAGSLSIYGHLLGRSGFKSSGIAYSENCSICVKALKAFFDRPIDNMSLFWVEHKAKLIQILGFIASKGRKSDLEEVKALIDWELKRVGLWLRNQKLTSFRIDCILQIISLTRENSMEPNLTEIQDVAYKAIINREVSSSDSLRLCQHLNLDLSLSF